jgi:hypothetical protein
MNATPRTGSGLRSVERLIRLQQPARTQEPAGQTRTAAFLDSEKRLKAGNCGSQIIPARRQSSGEERICSVCGSEHLRALLLGCNVVIEELDQSIDISDECINPSRFP